MTEPQTVPLAAAADQSDASVDAETTLVQDGLHLREVVPVVAAGRGSAYGLVAAAGKEPESRGPVQCWATAVAPKAQLFVSIMPYIVLPPMFTVTLVLVTFPVLSWLLTPIRSTDSPSAG